MTTLLALAAVCLQGGPPPFAPPALTPPALRVEPRFAPFALPEGARIVAASEGLGEIAEAFAADLRDATGRDLPVVAGAAGGGDIVLSVGGTVVTELGSDEASAVEVYGDHLALMGAGPRGVARAAARALQLVEVEGEGGVLFPPLLVVDQPAVPWRGLSVVIAEGPREDDAARLVERAVAAAHRRGWNRVVVRGPWTGDGNEAALAIAALWLRSTDAVAAARGRGVSIAIEMSATGAPPRAPDQGEEIGAFGSAGEVLLDARGATPRAVRAWARALEAHGLGVTASLDAGSLEAADALPGDAFVLVGVRGGLTARAAASLERPVVNAGALQLLDGDGESPTRQGWTLGALGGAAIVRGDALDAGLTVAGSLVPDPGAFPAPARDRILAALAGPAWTAGPWLTPPAGDGGDDAGAPDDR